MERTQHGFSLIEILIVLSIAAVLFAASSFPFLAFYRQVVFSGDIERVVSAIDEARKNTLSSYFSNQYGIHFETNRIVLFRGGTFTEPNPNNDEVLLSGQVEISDISLALGVDDLVFDRLTGETAQNGTITIRLKSDTSIFKIVTIHPSGLAEIN